MTKAESRRTYQQRYYREHREEILARAAAAWAESHPEPRKKQDHQDGLTDNQRYYRGNRERMLARKAAYYQENREKIKATQKLRYTTPDGRAKMNATTKKWAMKNPERHAELQHKSAFKRRLKTFGMTIEQYEAMWEAQGRCCAVCRSEESRVKRNGKQGPKNVKGWPSTARPDTTANWHIDHDHKTGAVRGILCYHCNTALGLFGDDIAKIEAAIKYLNH
jgi:hypothetical protein